MEGDHIYIDCGAYKHHGIDCGDGTVIHLAKAKGKVSRDTMSSFVSVALTGKVYVRKYKQCYPPSVVVLQAMDRLGEGGYDLFDNNCEHFATWCQTGQKHSQQVENFYLGTVENIFGTAAAAGLGAALGLIPLIEVTTAAPGILGFFGATTTSVVGVGMLPVAASLGGAYLVFKVFQHLFTTENEA